jgi:hypothetical protein
MLQCRSITDLSRFSLYCKTVYRSVKTDCPFLGYMQKKTNFAELHDIKLSIVSVNSFLIYSSGTALKTVKFFVQ